MDVKQGSAGNGMKKRAAAPWGSGGLNDIAGYRGSYYRPLLKSSRMSSRAMIILLTSDVPAPISQSF